jgi:signal transduction histidine kinase
LKFERLGQEVEGTGVGLTLVKRIVEVHGGEIWIESGGFGHGCSILFTLPRPL